MYLCYLDESGTGQVLNPAIPDSVPVMVIGGFTVPESQLKGLAWDFIALKKHFRPELRKLSNLSQVVHHEVKGEGLRKPFRRSSRKPRRKAHGFLDHLLTILEQHDCTVMARIWVKKEGVVNDDAAMYASSVTALCANFEHYLAERSGSGITVLDSRNPTDNVGNVHCVTTQKFARGGDRMSHVAESPLFGHSSTHLGLQIADLLVSAVLAPAAAVTYAGDLSGNVHCHPGFAEIRDRHCPRIGKLQHRYQAPIGKWTGGIVVSDARGHQSAGKLFVPDPAPATASEPLPGIPEQTSARDLATIAAIPDSSPPGP